MAGIFALKDLEARKRALITESEVYRETLKLEVQNLQLYTIRMQRKLSFFSKAAPLLLLVKPLTNLLSPRRKPAKRGLLASLLVGWRLYRQFAPMLGVFLRRFAGRKNQGPPITKRIEPTA